LTFSLDGTLFVGDCKGGAIYAYPTLGVEPPSTMAAFLFEDIDSEVATVLGGRADAVTINWMAVHPVSKEAYLSVCVRAWNEIEPALVCISIAGDVSGSTPGQKTRRFIG
jgi:hypothetical protein